MQMQYQSLKESIAAYNARKKEIETEEDKKVFMWKFVVIGLGVVFIILIGIMSMILKQISSKKVNEYNTSFLYPLLKCDSYFLEDMSAVQYLLHGLSASQQILYNSAVPVFNGSAFEAQQLVKKMKGHSNMLFFFQIVTNSSDSHRFGMYLQRGVPVIDEKVENLTVAEFRGHKVSAIFSLDQISNWRLNNTDACFLYDYKYKSQKLVLSELLTFGKETKTGQVLLNITNSACYGDDQQSAIDNVEGLTGISLFNQSKEMVVFLNRLQIFELSLDI